MFKQRSTVALSRFIGSGDNYFVLQEARRKRGPSILMPDGKAPAMTEAEYTDALNDLVFLIDFLEYCAVNVDLMLGVLRPDKSVLSDEMRLSNIHTLLANVAPIVRTGAGIATGYWTSLVKQLEKAGLLKRKGQPEVGPMPPAPQ